MDSIAGESGFGAYGQGAVAVAPVPAGVAASDRGAAPMVLPIDDDPGYRGALGAYLQGSGFEVREFGSFAAGLTWMSGAACPVVILAELTVESRHLFDCLARFRRPDGAVLVLSGQDDATDRIVALELGADDVMAKSVDRREILARVRAAIRRVRDARPAAAPEPDDTMPEAAAGWRFLSRQRMLVDPDGGCTRLTRAETRLLAAFIANAGKTLTRQYLSLLVLDRPAAGGDRGIDNLVAKLRRKLGDSARQGRMIRTAAPIGYSFAGGTNLTSPAQRD